ncbi:protoporphyrinogen oxidase [Williamsia sterculiae]|uniref:Coproporphyrinogen III oxidase n=1 Tax=Williamsia sterculiae TaxID=1344003 RepID=A0A1N7EFK4_9NOCA|nr:protoporphyrinogen oxidase [Williamsia sterculiae]SIR86871.1 oxygen-dependent protoporphyrinogen oxidase [Williamsia sterculiae]
MNPGSPAAGPARRLTIAVIGGGISGLVAAHALRTHLGAELDLDLFERSDSLGGLLRERVVAGRAVDVGAEAFVVRRPEVLALVDELGLSHSVVHPTGRRPALLARGRLWPLPRPTLMGVPAGPEAIADVADADDVDWTRAEPTRPLGWTRGDDPALGEFVTERFGASVTARSVDPMLAGVYSCRADDIGLRAALPQLAARLDAGAESLTAAVTGLISAGGDGPVFGTLDGGYWMLVDRLRVTSGATVHLNSTVDAVTHDGTAWRLGDRGEHVGGAYDGVVVALPAPAAATVLRDGAPEASAALRRVQVAGSALVSVALAPAARIPDHSGVLVATGEPTAAKAFTFSSHKWQHLVGDAQHVRISFGRLDDPVTLADDALVAAAVRDLGRVSALAGGAVSPGDVVDAVVQRWPVGLPRYAPGHGDLIATVDAHRPRGLALAGSAYSGVGVPACVGRARHAARLLVGDLADGTMGA